MNLEHQIEHQLPNGGYEYIDVDFEAEPSIQNDSFSYSGTHCTHGRGGTCRLPDYLIVEDIIWDEEKFTPAQNRIIRAFINVKKNFDVVADEFCCQYKKEKEFDYDYND